MRVAMFYHSLVSDWNHGNAHFLRGVASELIARGHRVQVYEPDDSWSATNLRAVRGDAPIAAFYRAYPALSSYTYPPHSLNLDRVLNGVDLVLVHEWNSHRLVRDIGEHHATRGGYTLLFHDTHHRSVTDPESMAAYDLRHYDGVLAFGEAIRSIYLKKGWAKQVWTWHEAADTRVFRPIPEPVREGDVVWIGNWGDDERAAELDEFLLQPVKRLGLKTRVHGVRYPDRAIAALDQAGIDYQGWLPNFDVPGVFARFRATVHVPRRPYASALPGIPTIRPFEALACGIPLVSAPWEDTESLFRPGKDYLVANDGRQMEAHLKEIMHNPDLAQSLAASGRQTILERHTCSHRVDQLLAVHEEIAPASMTIANTEMV
jgi:spore maturation protein CgeB